MTGVGRVATAVLRMGAAMLACAAALGGGALLVVGAGADPAHGVTVRSVDGDDSGSVVIVVGDVRVPRGDQVDNIVLVHGDVRIDGLVEGDVFVVNGDVIVAGRVRGDVTSLNGRVTLVSGARVDGDVVSKDPPRIAGSARVGGDIDRTRDRFALGRLGTIGRVFLWLAGTVSTLLLGVVILLVAPRGSDAVAEAGRSRLGAAVGLGFALLIGVPLVGALLTASLVGLPVGLATLLSLALFYGFGYTAGAIFVGRLMIGPPGRRWWAFFAGWGLLRVLAIVPVLGVLVMIAAVVLGLGSIAVAVHRSQRSPSPPEPAPPAGPAPSGPPPSDPSPSGSDPVAVR
jgi:hypothetical protein